MLGRGPAVFRCGRSGISWPICGRSGWGGDGVMGEKRPNKRKGLERHIESHLGRKLAPGEVETLMHQLERDGVLAFNDNKVEYRLPKSRK